MRLALAGLAISGTALLVACGGGGKMPNTPIATATTSTPTRPAATSTVVPAATATAVSATLAPAPPSPAPPAAAPSSTETPPPPPPPPPPLTETASGVTLTIVAVNALFDTRSLSAAAGPITIVFDNRDTSAAHNIHFFSKAGSIGMTEVMTGPATDVLSLGTLAPGAYSYKCDVHPTTMTGVLTVS